MNPKIILPHFQISLSKKTDGAFELVIIVTRKIRRAVDRNRIKRVVRVFFRQKRALLPETTVVCRLLPGGENVKNSELFQELESGLLRRLR